MHRSQDHVASSSYPNNQGDSQEHISLINNVLF